MGKLLGMAIAQALIGLLAWFLIGCVVLAIIDDKDRRLFKWAKDCPIPFGYELTVTAWPVILWLWWRNGRYAKSATLNGTSEMGTENDNHLTEEQCRFTK